MEEIKEYLYELDGVLADLEIQNNLMDLLMNNGFDHTECNPLEMKLEYERNQALIYTVSRNLREIEKTLNDNINSIYNIMGGVKNE